MRATNKQRIRFVAGAGSAVLALSLAVPGAAGAEPSPEPANPYYFTKDQLPKSVEGIPVELSREPELPSSMADLASGEPTCPAPTPLPGTNAGSGDGYTLPIRIKLTNGIVLSGHSAASAYWGQAVPFWIMLEGLTGWVNTRVQIPSMKLLTETADVTFCDGARLSVSDPGQVYYPETDWAPWEEAWSWGPRTQPDGSSYLAPPGTFATYLFWRSPSTPSGRKLEVTNFTLKSLDAAVVGIGANGNLQLSVDLDLDLDLQKGDPGAPGSFALPLGVSGTFTTAAKAPYAPALTNLPWDNNQPVAPPKSRSYLPAATLPGAVEGAVATVGSTDVAIDLSRLNTADPGAKSLGTSLYPFLYGANAWGQPFATDRPDSTEYFTWQGAVNSGTADFFPVDRGAADVSVDLTINKIGLPRGAPAGFGFDE